jgi:hypothetical protein
MFDQTTHGFIDRSSTVPSSVCWLAPRWRLLCDGKITRRWNETDQQQKKSGTHKRANDNGAVGRVNSVRRFLYAKYYTIGTGRAYLRQVPTLNLKRDLRPYYVLYKSTRLTTMKFNWILDFDFDLNLNLNFLPELMLLLLLLLRIGAGPGKKNIGMWMTIILWSITHRNIQMQLKKSKK